LKDVVSIVPGDFNNDGLPDLCVITKSGAALYVNQKGKFARDAAGLPGGSYNGAVWLDYDHDYDIDLLLLGAESKLVRNNGKAGFSDETASFPFVKGNALRGSIFELIADTNGTDVVVSYSDHSGVLYRDKLAGKYEAVNLEGIPSGATALSVFDINNDGWMDV